MRNRDVLGSLLEFPRRVVSALKVVVDREFMKEGITLQFYCGYRSTEEQDMLYAQGRDGHSGKRITNAKGGESYHQYGCAADCVPVLGGKPLWEAHIMFDRIGLLGQSLGLTWGGNFRSVDKPHFEITGGLTTSEMRGMTPGEISRWIEAKYKSSGLIPVLELVEKGGKDELV